jgi:hypothetical protein
MVSRQKKMRKRRPPMPALNRPGVGVIKLFSSFLIGGGYNLVLVDVIFYLFQ